MIKARTFVLAIVIGAGCPTLHGAELVLPQAGRSAALINPLARREFKDLTATRTRPLFVESRRAAQHLTGSQVAPPPPPAPPPLPPNVTVVGILKTSTITRAFLHSGESSKLIGVGPGDEVGGWRVAKIDDRSLLLEHGDKSVSLGLFKDFKTAQIKFKQILTESDEVAPQKPPAAAPTEAAPTEAAPDMVLGPIRPRPHRHHDREPSAPE
jgi:hypothetical protein